MTFQQRDMGGALFTNNKNGNESRPDYRGDLVINGVTYEIAGWKKQGRNGEFISLSAKVKQDREQARPPQNRPAPPRRQEQRGGYHDSEDADIPWR